MTISGFWKYVTEYSMTIFPENTKRIWDYTIPLSAHLSMMFFKKQILLSLFWTTYLKPDN